MAFSVVRVSVGGMVAVVGVARVMQVEQKLVGQIGVVLAQGLYFEEYVRYDVFGALVQRAKQLSGRYFGECERHTHVEELFALVRFVHERVQKVDQAAVERCVVGLEVDEKLGKLRERK